jgi:hypothetical protein
MMEQEQGDRAVDNGDEYRIYSISIGDNTKVLSLTNDELGKIPFLQNLTKFLQNLAQFGGGGINRVKQNGSEIIIKV